MKKILFFMSVTVSMQIFAAFPCPKDSCNPHNGCIEACTDRDYESRISFLKEWESLSFRL